MSKSRKLPSAVLDEVKKADLARVFIIGKYKDGKLYTTGSGPMFKHLEDMEQFIEGYRDGEVEFDD
jgi:hypothetical protein